MKLNKWFLFVTILVTIISTTTFAKTFIHQLGSDKIIFNIDNDGSGGIYHLDENQRETPIAQGKITAITQSSNNPNENYKVVVEKLGDTELLVRNDVDSSAAMAIIDGTTVMITRGGKIFPLPFSKELPGWKVRWQIKSIAFRDSPDEIYYVLVGARRSSAVFALLRERDGAYDYRVIDHGNVSLNTHYVAMNDVRKVFLADNFQKNALKNSDDNYVNFIAINALKPNPTDNETYLPKSANSETEVGATREEIEAQLKNQKAFLESRIKGQPEAIDLLYSLQMKSDFYGGIRKTPEKIYLMGLPGTGKDTIAEAYTDMLNGNKIGAYKDHLYTLPIVKNDADLWAVNGSATGYVGSNDLSDFIKWLVNHSGGKYKLGRSEATGGGERFYVEENPAWKPGQVIDGYTAPEKSVVFVNEAHNWAKKEKDNFLKQAIEKGIFHINNPGKGIKVLEIPVTFVFASNEGINLIAPRKANGERIVKKLSDEQLFENWSTAHNNPAMLLAELLKTNGVANGAKSEEAPGNSEEFLRRIPKNNIILLRPVFKPTLKEIIELKLSDLKAKMANANLTWTKELVDDIADYEYDGERGAGPVEDNLDKIIEKTLLQGIVDGKIAKPQNKDDLKLDIVKNEDRTWSLRVNIAQQTIDLPIAATEKFKPIPIKTDEDLKQLSTLGDRLKKHVFGAENITTKLQKDILVSDEGRNTYRDDPEKATEPARAYMFLGPSSTGKTEMAKALAREYLGGEDKMDVIDFNQITSREDAKVKILGNHDGYGNPIRSQFMEKYDAYHGHMLSVWDEFANSDRNTLKSLYDILREPVVRSFSDGVPRAMSNTVIVMTGNAGEEWYSGIPKEAPEMQQQFAREEIYKEAMKDPGFRRQTLEKYFSEALINRVGEQNIFFFPSLSFKAIRELSQLKLTQTLKNLETAENRRTFQVRFATKADYMGTLEAIEDQGYIMAEQGASIDRFVKQNFGTDLKAFLLSNLVPHQAQVVLQRAPDTVDKDKNGFINYKVFVNGEDKNLNFTIAKRIKPIEVGYDINDQHLTAMHEAGHNLVTAILMGDHFKPESISVIPGVTNINNHFIMYLGLARSEETKRFMWTKEAVLREMAVLWGGTVAQELTSNNFASDAGKSNDAERATSFAQTAILKWGLSPTWGTETVPSDMSVNDYIASMSEAKRQKFEIAVKELLDESRSMAEAVILTNMKTGLIPLGLKLNEMGKMDEKALTDFYAEHKPQLDYTSFEEVMSNPTQIATMKNEWADPKAPKGRAMSAKLSSLIPKPTYTANIQDIIKQQRAAAIAEVDLPENLPVANETFVSLPVNPKALQIEKGKEKKSADVKEANSTWTMNSFNVGSCTNILGSLHRKR